MKNMNTLDSKYQELLQDILDNGVVKTDRTGTGTISVFGRQIRHNMKQGFPLLTTKKMAWKTMVTELIWFLSGSTNIKYLVMNGCHIWDGDAYKNYMSKAGDIKEGYECGDILGTDPHTESLFSDSDKLTLFTREEFIEKIKIDDEFANDFGELGPIYGKQWRKWTTHNINVPEANQYFYETEIDQIQNLIDELKTNPDSRRLMVSAWNVTELNQMVLPPCHYGFQIYTRLLTGEERWELLQKKVGKESFDLMVEDIMPFGGGLSEELQLYNIPTRAISLMWNQRSVDTFLGLPFNIASYGLLLKMIADEMNMVPDELIGNLGDVHLYKNHIEQAKEQIKREPFDLPTVYVMDGIFSFGDKDVILENYQSHPTIKAPLSN